MGIKNKKINHDQIFDSNLSITVEILRKMLEYNVATKYVNI